MTGGQRKELDQTLGLPQPPLRVLDPPSPDPHGELTEELYAKRIAGLGHDDLAHLGDLRFVGSNSTGELRSAEHEGAAAALTADQADLGIANLSAHTAIVSVG